MAWVEVASAFVSDSLQPTAATTRSRTLGAAVAVGQIIEVLVPWYDDTNLTGIADDLGNSYAPGVTEVLSFDPNHQSVRARCTVAFAGTPTITATWDAATEFRALAAQAWEDDVGPNPPFDEQNNGEVLLPGTGANIVAGAALTVDASDSLIVGHVVPYQYEVAVPTAGTSPIAFTASAATINLAAGSGTITEWAQVASGSRACTFGAAVDDRHNVHAVVFGPAEAEEEGPPGPSYAQSARSGPTIVRASRTRVTVYSRSKSALLWLPRPATV